jgi:hypothetical protein
MGAKRWWLLALVAGSGVGLAAPAPVVDRGWFGCPRGYVDHPYDPDKCALPAAVARHHEMRAERRALPPPPVAPAPAVVPRQAPTRNHFIVQEYEREKAMERAIERGVARALEDVERDQ